MLYIANMWDVCVQLIFDEEFIGGKGLQGSCSQFRGRLAPWSDLLLVSRTDEFQDFKKKGGKGAKPAWQAPVPVVSPAAKKTAPGAHHTAAHAAPHQVKVLKRDAAAPPAKSSSYASVAAPVSVPLDAHGKPVLNQATGVSVGQKLLNALKKDDKTKETHPVAGVVSPASKVAILKKKIGIPEKAAAPASNGTGVNILAEAAGFSISDIGNEQTLLPSASSMQHHPMMGVISYQAQSGALNKSSLTTAPALPTPPTVAHNVHPPHAPPKSMKADGEKHASPQKQRPAAHAQGGSKLVLNKDATHRIVKHELKGNAAVVATTDKKRAADHKAELPAPSAGANTNAGAALLASMKQHKAAKKPAAEEHSAPVSAPATEGQSEAAPTHAPTAPLTMAEKLANAKKLMKEKQSKMVQLKKEGGVEAHHAPAAHPVTAPVTSPSSHAIKKTSSGEHKVGSHEKKAAPSIVSILTKAKAAAAAAEKPHAATAAVHPPVHHAPAGVHAPEPHVSKNDKAAQKESKEHTVAHKETPAPSSAAGASIASILLNAKRTSIAAAASKEKDASTDSAAPVAVAPTVSPTAVLKKKATNSLVPSKVIIAKK